MASLIASGTIANGGAVVEASDGTKCAVFLSSGSAVVYKDIDGTPSLVDSDTPTVVHGGGSIAWIDAAIDSNDDIHVVCACDAEQTRDVAYAVCDLTTGFGTWEEAADYTNQEPFNPTVQIAMDSGGIPRVVFVDNFKISGGATDQVYYTARTGGTWDTPERVNATATKIHHCTQPRLTCCPNDDIEVIYRDYIADSDADIVNRRRNGTWGLEARCDGDRRTGAVVCTTGDVVRRFAIGTFSRRHSENCVSIDNIFNKDNTTPYGAALQGNARYVFYVDSDSDVQLVSNDGSGWTNIELLAGSYSGVVVEWAYNNENQSGEINYLVEAATSVYYDSYIFPIAIPLDTLTLASSPQDLTVYDDVPIISMDSLTLAGSTPAIGVTVSPTIELDSLTLASSAVTCQVVVQDTAIIVYPGTLTLVGSVPNLTVKQVTEIDALSLAASIPDIYIPRMMKPLTLASSLLDLVQSSGSVIMPMDSISLAGSVPALTVLQPHIQLSSGSLAGSLPQIDVVGGIQLDSLTLAGSPVNIDDVVGGPVWTPLNTLATSGSAPGILIAHGFLPVPSYAIVEPDDISSLEIVVGGTAYQPEAYSRESHLFQPGATWQATVESCDKALWSNVTIKEGGIPVLTGYLLKRVDERGKCHISGMDTFAKVKSAWLTEEDIETEAGQTVAYWIDFIMGYIDLEYVYPPSANEQYVEPHVSLAPLSLYDALELVIRYAGLYIQVGREGQINFLHITDEVRAVLPTDYLEREKRDADESTRHQVSVYGMGSVKSIAEGDMLEDPVERIAVIDSPYIASEEDAKATAESALSVWNEHDDIRTIELAGMRSEHQLADYVTEDG